VAASIRYSLLAIRSRSILSRGPQRIAPLLRAFHGATGITVKVVYTREGLIDQGPDNLPLR